MPPKTTGASLNFLTKKKVQAEVEVAKKPKYFKKQSLGLHEQVDMSNFSGTLLESGHHHGPCIMHDTQIHDAVTITNFLTL